MTRIDYGDSILAAQTGRWRVLKSGLLYYSWSRRPAEAPFGQPNYDRFWVAYGDLFVKAGRTNQRVCGKR